MCWCGVRVGEWVDVLVWGEGGRVGRCVDASRGHMLVHTYVHRAVVWLFRAGPVAPF